MGTSFDISLDVHRLFQALLPLAFVLFVAGFVGSISQSHSPTEHLHTLVRTIVIIAVLSQFDTVLDEAQSYAQHLVTDVLHAAPDKVAEQYLEFIAQSRNDKANKSFWDRLLSPSVTLVEAVVAGVLWLGSLMAGYMLQLAYLFQNLVVQGGYGLAPVFFGFLAVNTLRPVAVQYFLSLSGVILWPFGWAIASLVTAYLMRQATDQSFYVTGATEGGLGYAFRNLIAGGLTACWIVVSTLLAPWLIQKAITTGAQVGLSAGGTALRVARQMRHR